MRDTDPVPPEEPPVTAEVESLTQQLLAPFESNQVKFKPAVVTGNRALALPYLGVFAVLGAAFLVTHWVGETRGSNGTD